MLGRRAVTSANYGHIFNHTLYAFFRFLWVWQLRLQHATNMCGELGVCNTPPASLATRVASTCPDRSQWFVKEFMRWHYPSLARDGEQRKARYP